MRVSFDSTKRIFPDSGVPYPLVSTVGFAIFAICRTRCEAPVITLRKLDDAFCHELRSRITSINRSAWIRGHGRDRANSGD
jgi:hypothetical protein